jgi:integrase
MALTQTAITKAFATDKPLKLVDSGGLHLLVQPDGQKAWRFRYRFAGRENMLSLGSFPLITLAEARRKRDDVKRQIADGIDPAAKRKLDRIAAATAAQNTFGILAEEHIAAMEANGAAESTISKTRWLLLDLARPLAKRPVAEIIPAEILQVLKRVERSGRRETARKLRGVIGAVFRHAIVTLRATSDPTAPLRGALLRPIVTHRPAITDERALGALMLSIDEYEGWPTIRAALQLVALTMTRPGDVRFMRRDEINFDRAIWRIPAERMKMRRPHDVPLSRQAIAILQDVWPLSDFGDLVLPSIVSVHRAISENAMNSVLRRLGYGKDEMVAHGFRAAASTILNERGINPDVIEAALAHQDENAVRRAYNRATYWPERVKLMQTWADLLDEFRASANDKRSAA